MSSFHERLANERRHLLEGPAPDEKPGGLGTVRFLGWCSGNAEQVIERARAVLALVNQHSAGEPPSDVEWGELLPAWFVSRCGPELSQEQAEEETARWRALSRDEQIRWEEERRWSLADWIYWFKPENRCWYWWDAKPLDDKVLVVAVEAYEWPFPSGALAWLLQASGAERIDAEPDLT
jgi:hypothetical protein